MSKKQRKKSKEIKSWGQGEVDPKLPESTGPQRPNRPSKANKGESRPVRIRND